MTPCKPVYGAGVNLSGLYHTTPVKMIWRDNLKEWYDSSGNFSVAKLGLTIRRGCTTFASYNRKEVAAWISGARTAMTALIVWAANGLLLPPDEVF